ncbi:hypothetical protein N431DRAFT_461799 [Stipitochalara longipes BDJ]|nr:hypothetical protein N431DRAFT_461799 [Stipitochalara longipes BDJ]
MERQHIEERYSDVRTVKAVLEIEFPKYKYPEFFKNNPKGFDIHMQHDIISFLAPKTLTQEQLDGRSIVRAHSTEEYRPCLWLVKVLPTGYASRSSPSFLELAYVLKYPECKKKAASGTESWVIRQLGVYQQYDKSTSRSLWIFLHCRPNSVAQERLTIALNNPCAVKSLQHYPIVLHLFLSSCYLNNWRSYMTYYDMELLKKSNAALGARLEDLPRVSYDTITNLRFLENKLATLPAIFSSLNLLFSTLETTMSSSLSLGSPYKTQLALYSSMIHSYHSNVSVLLRRCSSLSEFIVESTSHTQNGLIVRMAEASVKDSASIKVITIVTLAYLPASFVATFFGMQFFELSLPRLWIFFSLAAVLTIVTLGLWWWSLSQQGKSNKSSGEVLDALDVEKAVSTIPGYKAHVN